MIGQYLSNNNETVTVAFRQKICQLNCLDIQYIPTENASTLSRAHTHITVHRVAAARRQPGHWLLALGVLFRMWPARGLDWGCSSWGTIFFTPLVSRHSRVSLVLPHARRTERLQALIGSEVKSWRCAMDSTARKGDPPFGSTGLRRGGPGGWGQRHLDRASGDGLWCLRLLSVAVSVSELGTGCCDLLRIWMGDWRE
jgi:hypothetical protein